MFEIIYTIFRHAEILKQYFFSKKNKIVKENEASFEIFWNILIVKMKPSK
jgi:hypothetical protein